MGMNKEDLKGISLLIIHLAHIVYRNIQSHVKKKNWHAFPRDQPQPGFFLVARERILGTRFSKDVWLKKSSLGPCDFHQFKDFKQWKLCLCTRKLANKKKEGIFIPEVKARCLCWFSAAILVSHVCTPARRLHKKLYKIAWNFLGKKQQQQQQMVHRTDLRLR